MNYNLIPIL